MTDAEKRNEIAAMVVERNELRRTITCLTNKLDRIATALAQVAAAVKAEEPLSIVAGDSRGIAAGQDGVMLPPGEEIVETQTSLIVARERLAELERRIDSV